MYVWLLNYILRNIIGDESKNKKHIEIKNEYQQCSISFIQQYFVLTIIEYDKYNINLVYPHIYIFTLEDDYSISLYFHFNVNNNVLNFNLIVEDIILNVMEMV